MLFNTSEFIFLFLPVAVGLHFFVARWSENENAAVITTTLLSLFFYAWWRPAFVLLPALSILVNFWIARRIVISPNPRSRWILAAGIAVNLLVLGYFKYANFVVAIFEARNPEPAVVPLALSFTTFVQIAFLVDVWRRRPELRFPSYAMFVSFFPHLIAGPIVRWNELGPQIEDRLRYKVDWNNVSLGLTVFCFGLAKKMLIADRLSVHVAPVFDGAATGEAITAAAAWCAALAYSAQLYFDFSGYCDMAVGLGLLFNLRLPINFAAPLRSTSIIDLWRRWHISLSRFLRDFVYVPMGGGNRGPIRRSLNLVATMMLGGLWHGANWTFLAWGAFHGVLLAGNHAWSSWRGPRRPTRLGLFAGWLATFLAFVIGMVLFRSADLGAAWHLLSAMAGLGEVPGPTDTLKVGWDASWERMGYLSEPLVRHWFGINWSVTGTLWAFVAITIAFLVPDTMEFVDYREGEPHADWRRGIGVLAWRPSILWMATTVALFAFAFTYFWDVNEFLYYQF
jgi:alginate O-acetyltransferase complex protein AlgI